MIEISELDFPRGNECFETSKCIKINPSDWEGYYLFSKGIIICNLSLFQYQDKWCVNLNCGGKYYYNKSKFCSKFEESKSEYERMYEDYFRKIVDGVAPEFFKKHGFELR